MRSIIKDLVKVDMYVLSNFDIKTSFMVMVVPLISVKNYDDRYM